MTVIYKRQKIEDLLRSTMMQLQQRGTRRNLIGECCCKCKLGFETDKLYRRRVCQLCRYEDSNDKVNFLSKYRGIDSEEHLYAHYLARGLYLLNRKLRIAKAQDCKIVNPAISERLECFRDYIES